MKNLNLIFIIGKKPHKKSLGYETMLETTDHDEALTALNRFKERDGKNIYVLKKHQKRTKFDQLKRIKSNGTTYC